MPSRTPGRPEPTADGGAGGAAGAPTGPAADLAAHRLATFDRDHVWHPYAPVGGELRPVVVSASGVRLQLAGGGELIDGMSSWWAAIHGYRVPELDEAVRGQLGSMAHVMFGGLTHPPAVGLAERLLAMIPGRLSQVFFADSGSVAVEVAIKMAVQFWHSQGRRRSRLLTVRGGYHGDTFAAMSVCDPETGMHGLFRGALAEQVFAPRPPAGFAAGPDPAWLAAFRGALARHLGELAAVIVEPVVQGAGGMYIYPPWVLAEIRQACDETGVPLILDEIATGFGRTGRLFAAEHAAVSGDIVCVGKALTGGYLSLAATACSQAIADGIAAGPARVLMHGPTFMANPLATAVATASIDLLLASPWQHRVRAIGAQLAEQLTPARDLPHVADVRALGAIGVIETTRPVDVPAATRAAMARGVWLRPFGNLIYAMPPFVTGPDDLAAIAGAMLAAAAAA